MSSPVPRFRIRTRMTGRDTEEDGRSSSPLEALYDLTFVVAVAQVADQLAHAIERGQGLSAIVPFVMVFFAIWWAWINFTFFASAYDTDDVPYRLLTLLQMGGVLVLAAGVPAAFELHDFFGITLGYCIMRIGLVAQWIRAAVENPDRRTTAIRYAVGVTIVQLGWLARLLFPTDPAYQWWTVYLAFAVLAVLEIVVPYWAERTGITSWHADHIAERFGLFAIILLGETVAVLGAGIELILSNAGRVAPLVVVGVSSLVLIFALWWLYFLQPSGEGLAAKREGAYFWGYVHYFVFAALGALGAGLAVVVRFAGADVHLPPEVGAWAVAIPVAIYFVALLIANVRILPGIIVHLRFVIPSTILVLLLPLATPTVGLPTVLALISLVAAAKVAATMVLGLNRVGAS